MRRQSPGGVSGVAVAVIVGYVAATMRETARTMTHARHFAASAAVLLLLAGCQSEPASTETGAGLCRNANAAALDGRNRITDDEAKRLTGATIVRQIRPGDPVTMDLRRERVTIETDPGTDRIVRAFCG